MIELTLVGVIFVLCGLVGWQEYNNRKERKSLLNAILAKDNAELVNLELADKTVIKAQKPEDEFVPTDSISDDVYEEMIKNSIKE